MYTQVQKTLKSALYQKHGAWFPLGTVGEGFSAMSATRVTLHIQNERLKREVIYLLRLSQFIQPVYIGLMNAVSLR